MFLYYLICLCCNLTSKPDGVMVKVCFYDVSRSDKTAVAGRDAYRALTLAVLLLFHIISHLCNSYHVCNLLLPVQHFDLHYSLL